MMNKLIKLRLLASQVQSHPMIQSAINLSKFKRNKLYQSNKGMIWRINARERELTRAGKERRRSSNLIQPTSRTQTKIRLKSRNQQRETISMYSE